MRMDEGPGMTVAGLTALRIEAAPLSVVSNPAGRGAAVITTLASLWIATVGAAAASRSTAWTTSVAAFGRAAGSFCSSHSTNSSTSTRRSGRCARSGWG